MYGSGPIFTIVNSGLEQDITNIGIQPGRLRCIFSIKNNDVITHSATAIMTLNNGSLLKSISVSSTEQIEFNESYCFNIETIVPLDNNEYRVKIFIINNLHEVKPISNTMIFDKNGLLETETSRN